MIGKVKRLVEKIIQRPQDTRETILNSPEALAYSQMAVNNLEQKYEDTLFSVPLQFINFDVVMQSLAQMGHPAIQEEVTEPYCKEDFSDFPDQMAELLSDYMNTRLKILVNTVIQELMRTDQIKMSADADGVKYYTEEPNEDIDGILKLEKRFRGV